MLYVSIMGKQGVLDLRGDRNGQRRGGKRSGAGRPARGPRPSERHETRCAFTKHQPVHVVARVLPSVGTLRRREIYAAIREATITVAKRYAETGDGARIVHLSIQRTHLHLLVEANDKTALARGMQSFLISAARQINRTCDRRGTVFGDRYHSTVLCTPRQVRACVAYVLNNWRHHGEDRGRSWMLDPFSSAISFSGWQELAERTTMFRPPETYAALVVWLPKTRLLATGWRAHGLIGARERPGSDAATGRRANAAGERATRRAQC